MWGRQHIANSPLKIAINKTITGVKQWKPSELVNPRSYKELWQFCWMLVTISAADGGWHLNQPECKCSTWTCEQEERVNQSSACLRSFMSCISCTLNGMTCGWAGSGYYVVQDQWSVIWRAIGSADLPWRELTNGSEVLQNSYQQNSSKGR